MSKKTNRRLKLSEIVISEHARHRLSLLGEKAEMTCVRYVQDQWGKIPREPGHVVIADLVMGQLHLAAIFGTEGGARVAVVTAVESVVMRAKNLDPKAPGSVSAFHRVGADT